ncbi:cyclase family protein [Actinomadura roseirufa]|uniref:cyclase family protein n=1 Tax=Actinomadura roseirufa TaxID=2094049 RepID=UPI0010419F22|nr:cyclase family protein [Actinomadura roseirufa]
MTELIDLSVEVTAGTPGPPSTSLTLEIEHHHRGPGFWQVSTARVMPIHLGTHIDTPLHVYADGGTTSDLTLDDIAGEAAVFDLAKGPSEAVTDTDLDKADPGLAAGQVAVLRTGWSDRMWGRFPEYYTTSPWLHESGARWLAERAPRAVVFDFFEEECARNHDFTSEEFVVHRILLGAGIYLVEHATNLGALLGHRTRVYPAFTRIGGIEGAHARLFAVVED